MAKLCFSRLLRFSECGVHPHFKSPPVYEREKLYMGSPPLTFAKQKIVFDPLGCLQHVDAVVDMLLHPRANRQDVRIKYNILGRENKRSSREYRRRAYKCESFYSENRLPGRLHPTR